MTESTAAYSYINPPLYGEIDSNAQTESISLSVTYPFACFKFAHYLQTGEK